MPDATSTRPTAAIDTPAYGYPALFEVLAAQGVSRATVLDHAGLVDAGATLRTHDHVALMRAAQRSATDPLTALSAGQRQQVANYGAYGYALATSATMGEALRIAMQYLRLAGAVLRISFEVEDGVGVWRSHRPESLGEVLPFVAEYWRSSLQTVFSQVLGERFPSLAMSFPYRAPAHGAVYREVFGCPVAFGAAHMEWRFDAAVFDAPCAGADPLTAQLCADYCEQFVQRSGGGSPFRRELLRACVHVLATSSVAAPAVARHMNLSLRTFYRRLADEGLRFQDVVDRLLGAVALEYLEHTDLSVEQIAERCGYRDPANFRKAFRRWTGATPSAVRAARRT